MTTDDGVDWLTILNHYANDMRSEWLDPKRHSLSALGASIDAEINARATEQATRVLIGDVDNWQPTGILAALDHTDTNTTVSMLPDWASQQRPE